MYYKELYFQGQTIRFIDNNIVVKDIYAFFCEDYPTNLTNVYKITQAIIKNLDKVKYKDVIFETYTFYQVGKLLDQFKNKNKPVEIFRNWLSNFAYVYIEDFVANSINLDTFKAELREVVYNLKNRDTDLNNRLDKVEAEVHSQNYSLDIFSSLLKLDIDITDGNPSSKVLDNINKDIREITSIICEQVGLEVEPEVKPTEDTVDKRIGNLTVAFEKLKDIYGIFTEVTFNSQFLRTQGYNLSYRAKNRKLTLIEYIASDKHITKLVLDYIASIVN